MTFFIQPGKRVYVRRINISGNTKTQDDVLRRQFRQLEGAWYSQGAIDRSKLLLQQLGYVKDVKITNQRVPGTDDQVDLDVKLEEQNSGSLQFGLGYSQYSGLILNGSISQRNFLGTGDRFTIGVQHSDYYQSVNLGYVNPNLTDGGVSIGYNLTYSKLDYGNTDLANYTNSTRSFSTYLGIPLTDFTRMQLGLGLSSNRINLFDGLSPQSFVDYQNAVGHKTSHTWTLTTGVTHDTRNSYWAATRGGLQSLSVNVALPGSTVQFLKAYYEGNHYWPIGKGFVLYLDGQIGYGATYGNQT